MSPYNAASRALDDKRVHTRKASTNKATTLINPTSQKIERQAALSAT
jgi:hypothetical protein